MVYKQVKLSIRTGKRISLITVVSFLVGFLASWRLQFESGTIGLFHDWSIPASAKQNVALASQIFDGWYKWSLGYPVTFPTEYPFRFALGALGLLGIGGNVTTHVLVFLIPAAAFLSAWLLTRSLTGSYPGAIAAGIFYALNPVVLNKMISGQMPYMIGYCMLPLVIWMYKQSLEASKYPLAAVGFGAILAITGVQLQLGLLAAFISIIIAITARTSSVVRRCVVLIIGFITALVIHMSTIIGIMSGASGFENLTQFSNSLVYLQMNSIPFSNSLRLIGYLTHYDVTTIAQWSLPWNLAMGLIIIVAAIGIFTANAEFRNFAILTFVPIVVLMTGTVWIFGPEIRWLFQHVRFMEAFRELYHLMVLPSLIYACGIAFFFRLARQFRQKITIYAILWVCVIMVSVPMLTGDEGGWVKAFPLKQAYGDVLDKESVGENRVLWLPMDQPVSFNWYGAGVDPMAVTTRGSLWDYSLNWPLRALDTDIRTGSLDIGDALRVLNVGDVVIREGMESQLSRFTIDPIDAEKFFSPAINVRGLPLKHKYRASESFQVRAPFPIVSFADQSAVVPQRLSVYVPVRVAGYAPLPFGANLPSGIPYALFYDRADIPEESLELEGLSNSLPSTTIDARFGFAPNNMWWWHRPEYADVPNATIAFGEQQEAIQINRKWRDSRLILAWIATPVGGRIKITVNSKSFVINTNGLPEWRSVVLPLGKLQPGDSILLSTLDSSREVTVRNFTIISADRLRASEYRWKQLKAKALNAQAIFPGMLKIKHIDDRKNFAKRLLILNWSYSDNWRTLQLSKHFKSAIGTNIFELSAPTQRVSVYYTKELAFHIAFSLGTMFLILAFSVGFVALSQDAKSGI